MTTYAHPKRTDTNSGTTPADNLAGRTTCSQSQPRLAPNTWRKMHNPELEPANDAGFASGLWSQILPGLYMGGTDDDDVVAKARNPFAPANITTDHFDLVVTAYGWARPVDWMVAELRVCFYDAGMANVPMDQLRLAVTTAHSAWKSGKRVLARCQMGANRSGLITALVLIRDGYTPRDAINLIRQRRMPEALFNREFERWLLEVDAADWQA